MISFVGKLTPYALLAVLVFGFLRLADHYAWSGGVTVLIGTLMLAIFVMVFGLVSFAIEFRRVTTRRRKA